MLLTSNEGGKDLGKYSSRELSLVAIGVVVRHCKDYNVGADTCTRGNTSM